MIPHQERPPAVTAIATYESLRAATLLLILVYILFSPGDKVVSSTRIQFLTYIVAGHSLPPAPLVPIVLPVLAVYFIAVGAGLWMLKSWARNLLIVTSGLTVVLWVRYYALRAILHGSVLNSHLQRDAVLILVVLDSLVFCQLTFSPGVRDSFRRR